MKSYADRFYRDIVEMVKDNDIYDFGTEDDNDIYDFGTEDDNDIYDFGIEDYVSNSSPSTDDGEFGSED